MKLIKLLTLGLLFGVIKADQPVHCIREQLFGVWNFHVGTDKQTVNLFDTQEVCTHNVPNKIQLINADYQFKFAQEDIYRTNLLENYKVEAAFCKGGGKCDNKIIHGIWTAIYDQALNIELDNGMRFLANLRYNIKKDITADPYKSAQDNGVEQFGQIETGDYDKFESSCKQTMVGFVHNLPEVTGQAFTMANHQVQCFHGTQEKHYTFEKSKLINNGKVKWNKITEHFSVEPEKIFGQLPTEKSNVQIKKVKAKKRVNMHLAHKPSDQMDLLISEVNEANLGWKADVCKYQKTHPKYGAHCDKDNQPLILAQTSDDGGEVVDETTNIEEDASKKPFGVEGDKDFEAAQTKAALWQKKYKNAQDIPDSEIPESLDYRDIDGYDFTSYFRDQGKCGSCYTISMTQVMESRIKLKYGKQPPMLSPQQLMTCNYMNEGCDGGWPHFNVFMAENGHVVSEECAPYIHATKGDKCKNYEKCAPIGKVKKSYFVGGGWGNTSEKKMMKEILRNGVINGDFQAPSMFSIYKEGIFSEKGLIDIHKKNAEAVNLAQKELFSEEDLIEEVLLEADEDNPAQKPTSLSDKTLNDRGISWMDMNHSVVILGWGKEEKTGATYWIVRNSYGPTWGMNGDFLVKRGNNDFGMEVEQIAFEPILCEKDKC